MIIIWGRFCSPGVVKPNNMVALMDVEKLNEFNLLKEDVEEVG